MKAFFVAAFFCLGLSGALSAHPSHMGRISGTDVDLKTIGHSISGSVRDRLILGRKLPGAFESELRVLEHDQETVSRFFTDESGAFGGLLNLGTGEGARQHSVKFVSLRRDDNIFEMSFDGEVAEVLVTSEGFENHHFINPEYSMNFRGKSYSFKMEDGQACYGYSVHLITMIFGSLIF